MNLSNLNITKEQKESYQQKLEELKKPTIPPSKLLRLMLLSAETTKAGKERAALEQRETNIMDGLSLEWLVLGYYESSTKYVPIIDYSNIEDVKFPFEGDITVKKYSYFTTKSLVYQGYKEPKDPESTFTLFRQWLDRQFGVRPEDELKEGLIIHVRQYVDKYVKKEDKNSDGTPKKGAQEQTSFVLTCYNREAEEAQPVAVQYMTGEQIVAIATAVVEHVKKYAKDKKDDESKVDGVPF